MMRQDAWSKKEDQILAKIVTTYIDQGKTQLDAFKQAGLELERTAAACGYRWNAVVRKQLQSTVENVEESGKEAEDTLNSERMNMLEDAIAHLKKWKEWEVEKSSQPVDETKWVSANEYEEMLNERDLWKDKYEKLREEIVRVTVGESMEAK
ncbi:hypothetical protein [Salsuginibacillus kocurii]|uniref:hypothetical protein n=1 Tax=Salsuginibacillus kocurii TaxID=427078 RepID=UPI0003A0A33D|nr:hypothetical protein [Salsuginibacillus kocurii]